LLAAARLVIPRLHEEFAMPQFQPTIFPDFRFPLSGNVNQTINPWTWFFRGISQFGLVNINLGSSADPDLEQQILDDVAAMAARSARSATPFSCLRTNRWTSSIRTSARRSLPSSARSRASMS
jgi:hypothetical protein